MILLLYLWSLCCNYIIIPKIFFHYQDYDSKEKLSEKSPRLHRMLQWRTLVTEVAVF